MGKRTKADAAHASQCSVCAHPEKLQIEKAWRSGVSGRKCAELWDLHKNAVNRHVAYYGLQRDLELALEAIIESGVTGLTEKGATAAHANEAIKSMAKLRGLWVDRTELLPPGWEGRSEDEIAFFAAHGRFPAPGEVETVQ